MTGREYKETGRYAYEAYAAAVGYRNYQGGVMLHWDDPVFPENIRDAWREAARAAIRYGWQGGTPPQVPRDWEHVGGDDDTRTSHRVR